MSPSVPTPLPPSASSSPLTWRRLSRAFRAHPWHGVELGPGAPERVTTYIEIVPTDSVKYELDKATGLLRVDRPQRFSNVCPALYGFLPRTFCGDATAAYCMEKTGRPSLVGDADPLDICVLTEKAIPRGDILIEAIPVGGLRMLDGSEVDDKIIAVLAEDAVYGGCRSLGDLPRPQLDRLRHYFLTYKEAPDSKSPVCEITHVYDRAEAHEVIRRSQADYESKYGDLSVG